MNTAVSAEPSVAIANAPPTSGASGTTWSVTEGRAPSSSEAGYLLAHGLRAAYLAVQDRAEHEHPDLSAVKDGLPYQALAEVAVDVGAERLLAEHRSHVAYGLD